MTVTVMDLHRPTWTLTLKFRGLLHKIADVLDRYAECRARHALSQLRRADRDIEHFQYAMDSVNLAKPSRKSRRLRVRTK
jgi:hypothetical protein